MSGCGGAAGSLMWRLVCGALALACWLPQAGGQNAWQAGLHAGAVAGGNLRGDSACVGAQLIYCFLAPYSLELAVGRYKAETTGADAGRRLEVVSSVLHARVHLSPLNHWLRIYGGPGLGLYAVDETPSSAGESAGESTLRPRLSLCLGLEAQLTERLELFADYRYTFLNLAAPNYFNHGLVRFGINFGF